MMAVCSSDTWLSRSVSLSASNYIFLSPCQTSFLSPTLSVCIKLQISLFFSPSSTLCPSTISPSISLSASNSISHSWCMYISHLLSPSLHLTPSLSASCPATVCLCLSLPPLSLFLAASLSLAVCLHLSQWTGWFLWGLHSDMWWNGVSLYLRCWRHFTVRITTPDIDGEETLDFRGHCELAGRRGEASKQCTHQL